MRIKSSLQDLESAVEKEINSKYDYVKLVADNMDAVIAASLNANLISKYLGAFAENPILHPDGSDLVNGNFYFNTSIDNLGTYYYDSESVLWIAVSGSTAGVYDDTSLLAAVALNTNKVSNVNHPLVEKAVPSNAVFIDTTYSVGDNGLTEKNFTTEYYNKLTNIDENANNYVLPFTNNAAAWNIAVGWGNHNLAGYITGVTLDNTNFEVADTSNLQNFAGQVDKALRRARGTGVSTSYVASVSVGGTTFSVPALEGEINSDEGYFSVIYSGEVDVTVLDLSSSSTWIYIDKNNVLQQQTSFPTRQDRTRKVFLMRIGVSTSSNQIINFEYDNNPIGHYANSMRDLYEFLLVQGVPFKKDQVVTGRSDNLGFDVSSGQILEFGGTGDINNPNIKSFNAVSNANYNLMSRTELVSLESNLLKYWDNNGVLTALGSTTCVAHRLFRFSSGNFAMQPGQGNYANIVLCKAGAKLEEYVLNPALKNATFFGWWLIEETATSTYGTVNAEFVEYTLGVQGGSSSGLSGALLRGNNFSDLLDATLARSNLGINTTENQTDSLDKRFVTDLNKNKLAAMPSTLVVSEFPTTPVAGTLYIKV
jgi:hypothetical protein